MSNRVSLDRVGIRLRSVLARRRSALDLALVLAAFCLPTAAAASAAPLDGGSGTGNGRAGRSSADLSTATPQPSEAELASPWPTSRAALPQEVKPSNASTGFFLGNVGASWGSSGVRMTASSIQNQTSSTSNTLILRMWATTTRPIFGNTISAYDFGPDYVLGPLAAGFQFTNVDTGLRTPYIQPPSGCYFVTLALLQYDSSSAKYLYVDFVTFNSGGVADPGGSGFDLFGFGVTNGSCAGTGCTRDTNTACLVSGRFRVTVSYNNSSSSGNASVMSFNGTRAENDESVFLYFTDATNFEMGLKILPACGLNSHFWVFISGLTNQGWTVTIYDTSNGSTYTYSNGQGHLTKTTADTGAISWP